MRAEYKDARIFPGDPVVTATRTAEGVDYLVEELPNLDRRVTTISRRGGLVVHVAGGGRLAQLGTRVDADATTADAATIRSLL